MKKLAMLLLFVSLPASAAQYVVKCFMATQVVVIENVVDYGDDMMTYKLTVTKDGKTKYIRVPKNMCLIEETK